MLIFKKLRYKNFLSTGNQFTTIDLNQNSATLVFGTNGHGKSTFIDALTFGLFGKPYRNINIPTLVNSINDQDLVVEVEFLIGRRNYLVRRGLKPKIFEIYQNGKLIPQDSKNKDYQSQFEQNILKLNYRSFTQVVVLGSATFVPFMRLAKAERRFLIEDLLDIKIFSMMNSLLKQKFSQIKDSLYLLENEFEISKEKLSLQKQFIQTLKADNKQKIQLCKDQIKENQVKSLELQNNIDKKQKEIDELLLQGSESDDLSEKIDKLDSIQNQIEKNIDKTQKVADFYIENDSCPVCKQSIDSEFKTKMVQSKKVKLDELKIGLKDLKKELLEKNQQFDKCSKKLDEANFKQKELTKLSNEVSSINKYISKLQSDIESLSSKKDIKEADEKKIVELQKQIKELEVRRDTLIEDKHYLDIVSVMLKDTGIKTRIIKQYLPLINKYVNKYLGDLDFFVNFNFDENFKEEIKSRGRDNFSYENFSEGEKLRIDLAILFAFREISRMKNQSNCNILILDEILDRSLDAVGIDDFLKIMYTMGKKMNIFIISPRGELFMDKFPATLRFAKIKNFSVITND